MNIVILKNIIIFCVLVGIIYFILKKCTIYRCPKCQSRHIAKIKSENPKEKEYICQNCGNIIKKKIKTKV